MYVTRVVARWSFCVVLPFLSTALVSEAPLKTLAERLKRAKNTDEATKLIKNILAHPDDEGESILQLYASQSLLRAFEPSRRVFLLHDPSTAKTYRVLGTLPKHTGAAPPGAKLAKTEEHLQGIAEKLYEAQIESVSIGTPLEILSGILVLPLEKVDEKRAKVTFVLRTKQPTKHYKWAMSFEGRQLTSGRISDVTKAELRDWQSQRFWPKGWLESKEKTAPR